MNQPTLFEPGPNGCERVAYAPTTGDVAWLRSQAALMAHRADKIERVMDVTK